MSEAAHVKSYWAATAQEIAEFGPLDRDSETDVAIVGAGFTGLSTAYHLNKRGRPCTILEAQRIGWGASGRTGGHAVPRFRLTYPELEKRYGLETALRMYHMAHEAVNILEGMIIDVGLKCGFERCGHITPIQHQPDVARFAADVEWLRHHASDQAPRMLDAIEVSRKIGSQFYRAGYFEPRGAGIHPLDYCESMAKGLFARGTKIFCGTPVTEWRVTPDGVVITTPKARIKAKHLVIATNAYTDTTDAGEALKRRVVPIVSSQIATAPLPSGLLPSVLPDGNLATDAKRLTNYFRRTSDNRLMFGGRAGASDRESSAIFKRLERGMAEIFPQLRGAPIDFRWSGRVALALDNIPHIGLLNDRVSYGLGYSGRGVALSALFGSMLARLASGESVDLGPLSKGAFEPIPFHAFRVPGKAIAITYKRVLDAIGI